MIVLRFCTQGEDIIEHTCIQKYETSTYLILNSQVHSGLGSINLLMSGWF